MDGYALQFANELLRSDKELVTCLVSRNGFALQFASFCLRNDCEVVLVAVANDWKSMQFASKSLRNNVDFVLKAMCCDWRVVQFASGEVMQDPEVYALAEECGALELFAEKCAEWDFSQASSTASTSDAGDCEFDLSIDTARTGTTRARQFPTEFAGAEGRHDSQQGSNPETPTRPLTERFDEAFEGSPFRSPSTPTTSRNSFAQEYAYSGRLLPGFHQDILPPSPSHTANTSFHATAATPKTTFRPLDTKATFTV
jgi:hypothetical protein